ncbi:hypothetical protein [Nocardiopsis valliformis]|uniref:hypothetical protein n=1 Tax=Nocardiopsis valliformis TaxID=239974 RepID=UPI0003454A50|nr:hypothetical protein [Nocardiopsis valliformis]
MTHQINAWVCENLRGLRERAESRGRGRRAVEGLARSVLKGEAVTADRVFSVLRTLDLRPEDLVGKGGDRSAGEGGSALDGLGLGSGAPVDADYACRHSLCPRQADLDGVDGEPFCEVQNLPMTLKPLSL